MDWSTCMRCQLQGEGGEEVGGVRVGERRWREA